MKMDGRGDKSHQPPCHRHMSVEWTRTIKLKATSLQVNVVQNAITDRPRFSVPRALLSWSAGRLRGESVMLVVRYSVSRPWSLQLGTSAARGRAVSRRRIRVTSDAAHGGHSTCFESLGLEYLPKCLNVSAGVLIPGAGSGPRRCFGLKDGCPNRVAGHRPRAVIGCALPSQVVAVVRCCDGTVFRIFTVTDDAELNLKERFARSWAVTVQDQIDCTCEMYLGCAMLWLAQTCDHGPGWDSQSLPSSGM
jgi:hypothetical protein